MSLSYPHVKSSGSVPPDPTIKAPRARYFRPHQQFSARLILLFLLVTFVAGLLAGCDDIDAYPGISAPPGSTIEPAEGQDTMSVVEAYMQTFQPGPTPRLFQTTRIYDRDDVLIAELSEEGRRTWIPLEQVSPFLIQATIATEDASFYANNGIDAWRMAGAMLRNVRSGSLTSGASTITMQLVRNLFIAADSRYDHSLNRKLLEVGVARELTALYTKDEILEMYLNLLNYGQLAYGPEAAAQVYFGKPAADLTMAEATLLAGLPQQPAYLNPYLDFEAARSRQRIVLDLMVRHGYLSATDADAVYLEPITLIGEFGPAPNLAPHFVQYVIQTLDSQFGEGYTRRSGLNITTTLDMDLQQMAQDAVADNVARLLPAYGLSNAALVAMAPNSGEIVAMVGSANFDDPSIAGQVNVALRQRQPGSAIKPVLYATAIEQNAISPASVIWDTRVEYRLDDGKAYAPRNYDRIFHGPVTVRSALASSYNIPAVKLLDSLGVENMLAGAQRLGINGLDRGTTWYGLSLALGGGEVTLLDLTTAYHTLASGGEYLPPKPILSMVDNMGNTLDLAGPLPDPVVSPETAFLISDILSDNEARRPGFGANSPLQLDVPAAVKTGTTNDFRDNWTLGYTPYLVAGVWAGNSDGTPMRNATGVTGAAPIWRDFMAGVQADPLALETLNAGDDVGDPAFTFAPPEGIVRQDGCAPGVACKEGGEYYRASWLDVTQSLGASSPLADSVTLVRSAPVYVRGEEEARLVGFCATDDANERFLLTMKTAVDSAYFARSGLPADEEAPGDSIAAAIRRVFASVQSGDEPLGERLPVDEVTPVDEAVAVDSWTDEHLAILMWSLEFGASVNMGPCDELAAHVSRALDRWPVNALAGKQVLVDLGAAYSSDVGVPGRTIASSALIGPIDIASVTGPEPEQDSDTGTYVLNQPIVHNDACPGGYIMGIMLNSAGGPVPGVIVSARDEWGNTARAVSKSGGSDFGQFDLPVHSSTPHTIYVTVLDESGNPISPTVSIEHGRGEGGTASCHHVVFQSVDNGRGSLDSGERDESEDSG